MLCCHGDVHDVCFSPTGTGLSLALLALGFLLSAQNAPSISLHPLDPQNSTCSLYE